MKLVPPAPAALGLAIGLAMGLASASAFAAGPQTGVINFTGYVVDTTCVVDANSTNMNVVLPNVDKTLLAQSNSRVGETAFVIRLTGCVDGPETKVVSARFAPDGNVNTDGTLANTGSATNVAIELVDRDSNVINIHADDLDTQAARGEYTADGVVNLRYVARYFSAQGNAGAGDVRAMANFQLVYQ